MDNTRIPKTETCLIAFLDILGFKKILGQNNEGLELLLGILRKMRIFQQNFAVEIQTSKNRQTVKISSDLSTYSDHLIISIPIDKIPNELLTPWSLPKDKLRKMYHIQKRKIALQCICELITRAYALALSEGVALRGAISIGKIYYSNHENIFLGNALIEAIGDERNAKYPRVMVSHSLLNHLQEFPMDYNPTPFSFSKSEIMKAEKNLTLPCFIIQDDEDDCYYINWFDNILHHKKFIPEHSSMLLSMRENINRNINNKEHEKDILEKWDWLARFFNKNIIRWNNINAQNSIETLKSITVD